MLEAILLTLLQKLDIRILGRRLAALALLALLPFFGPLPHGGLGRLRFGALGAGTPCLRLCTVSTKTKSSITFPFPIWISRRISRRNLRQNCGRLL